jgi:hypothetical protein
MEGTLMPAVLVAAAASTLGTAAATAIAAGTLSAISWGSLAVSFITTAVVGAASQFLGQSKKSNDFKSTAGGLSTMVRQATPPGKVVYGTNRVSGPIAFINTTDNNKWLHMVVILSCHEIESIDHIFFDDSLILLDDDGNTTDDRYFDKDDDTPLIRIKKHLGGDGQSADPDLVSENGNLWSTNHRLRGNSYLYIKLGWQDGLWQNGIPNVSAICKGKKLYDPRTATTGYSTNASLVLRDYLSDSTYGLKVPSAELDDTTFNAAANVCEETVSVTSYYVPEYPTNLLSSPSEDDLTPHSLVDTHDGTEWLGRNETLYNDLGAVTFEYSGGKAINQIIVKPPVHENGTTRNAPKNVRIYGHNVSPLYVTGYFAANGTLLVEDLNVSWDVNTEKVYTFANSTSYTYYTIEMTQSDGRSVVGLSRAEMYSTNASELRYPAAGVVDTANIPKQNIEYILSAMSGTLVYQNGSFKTYAGEYRSPTLTLNEDDIISTMSVQTRTSRKDLFNTVKGVFTDPLDNYQPVDFPVVTNSTYVTEDGGDELTYDAEFPFTQSPAGAQRLAKILLERNRRQIRCKLRCKMTAFDIQVGDTIYLSYDRFGWSSKTFEVVEWSFALVSDDGGAIRPEVGLELAETDSSVWSWSTEETAVERASQTSLPNPFLLRKPTGLTWLSGDDYIYIRADGTATPYARINWTASSDSFVVNGGRVELQAKMTTAPAGQLTSSVPINQWVEIARLDGGASTFNWFGSQDNATYSIRTRFVNQAGTKSPWTEIGGVLLEAKAEPPEDVGYLIVNQNGNNVTFSWPLVADLDLQGYEVRYGPQGSSNWEGATPLVKAKKSSTETTTTVPPGEWDFFIKSIDNTGNYSVSASKATELITNPNTIIDSLLNTDFSGGTLVNMVRHYTGVLTAQDKKTADEYDFSTFDLFVPNPKDLGTYTTEEIDLGFDDKVRVVGVIESKLGPGVSEGEADPVFELSYILDGQEEGISLDPVNSVSTAGTTTNMILDYRGNVIPQSQNLGSDDSWSTFDVVVPNPYDTCSYEAEEIDVSADRTMTFTIDETVVLAPGETGATTHTTSIDYRKSADSYTGFEEWNTGRISARYIKHKVTFDTGTGLPILRGMSYSIDSFNPWTVGEKTARKFQGRIRADYTKGNYVITDLEFYVDREDRTESASSQAVGSSGTTITFDQAFHNTPRVQVTPQSGSATIAVVDNVSTTGFDINLYNTSGTGVTGAVSWTATGV